jgi:hypothetical protein
VEEVRENGCDTDTSRWGRRLVASGDTRSQLLARVCKSVTRSDTVLSDDIEVSSKRKTLSLNLMKMMLKSS